MKIAQSRQKSYADNRRRPLEFEEGDHIFLKVTPTIGIGRSLRVKKLSLRFIGPYQILHRVGPVAYQLALPPSLSGLHDVFNVSQLKKYIHDPSQTLHHDSIQLKPNLTFKPIPSRIVDRNLKTLRKNTISLVKVVWEGMSPEDATWELESEILEKYRHLFY
ncbi:uncharacterized protein [Cicer arietinum]|uniref:uncharacterized protein n=1 Tax=Cicer arietinum TaxID=3827 RepID=UPI003CC62609